MATYLISNVSAHVSALDQWVEAESHDDAAAQAEQLFIENLDLGDDFSVDDSSFRVTVSKDGDKLELDYAP